MKRLSMVVCGLLAAAVLAADPAPEFSLQDTHGQPVSLKGYRGAVVFLAFGATW